MVNRGRLNRLRRLEPSFAPPGPDPLLLMLCSEDGAPTEYWGCFRTGTVLLPDFDWRAALKAPTEQPGSRTEPAA